LIVVSRTNAGRPKWLARVMPVNCARGRERRVSDKIVRLVPSSGDKNTPQKEGAVRPKSEAICD
jgi:hypothetical protein